MRFFANMPIVIKVLFIVAVPLVMLGLFMVDEIRQAYKNEASMQIMLHAADLSGAVVVLVGEIQKERGMSAGFLGSSGKRFSDKLKLQQSAVNQAFSELRVAIRGNTLLFNAFPPLRELSEHFIMDMDRLENMRQSIRKLDISVEDELKYYIGLVDDLMQMSNYIKIVYTFGEDVGVSHTDNLLIVPDARFSGLLSSFILLGRVGEAAGIERAVLSNTFGLDHFGPGMYERFVSLVAQQQQVLHEFSLQSPEFIRKVFSSLYAGDAIMEVEYFRNVAMDKAGQGGFGIDPEQWFFVSSQRIKVLHQVEAEIVELIRLHGRYGVEQAGNHIRDNVIRVLSAILIAASLSMWATWLLLLGIRRASQAVQSIEAGEYTVPVVVKGSDEMGRMLAGVERMRLSLMATEHERAEQEKKAQTRLEALLRTKDELRSEHDLIKYVLAAMPSILIAVDSKGDISLWNDVAENTFGLASEDMTGSAFSSLTVDWDWEKINPGLEKSKVLHECSLDHVKFRRLDGTDGFLELTINAVLEDGQYNGLLLIAADKTERMMLENQLQTAQKMESMGELAAGIAHEINTPMQYIGDNVRFLKDGFNDLLPLISSYHLVLQEIDQDKFVSEQQVSDIKQAEQDADVDFLREEVPVAVAQTLEGVAHVSKIVGAMKELSHPGTGEKMSIDINKIIESTVTVSRNEWKYVAGLDMELDPELPMIHALPEINQVFLNIIVNAAHAIEETLPEGSEELGKINIFTSCTNDIVEIRICDSGPGISKEKQAKVFDPFFTTKDPGKGTGQGLAISHQIVCNRLGGRLTVESEPGHGACFIIQLPMKSES